MKLWPKIVSLALACALVVATYSIVGPRTIHAVVAALVRDVDNPARQPFVSNCVATFDSGGRVDCIFPLPVPLGKELVIEMFTAFIEMNSGQRPLTAEFNAVANGTGYALFYPLSFNGSSKTADYWAVQQPLTRAYADPNSNLACLVTANLLEGQFAHCYISGYLVNVP
jgi:hypothetical protein